jgi:Protein of unknown function (DUF2892)
MKLLNLSPLERLFRIALGAGMLAAAWSAAVGGLPGRGLEVFGWVPLLTGILGWCPFYALLGLNSRVRPAKRGSRPEVR